MAPKKINNHLKLILLIVSFQLIGVFMGLITKTNIKGWYAGLNKSTLTPPGLYFSIVWTILYLVLAYLAWIIFFQSKNKPSISYLTKACFAIQMILNWLWSPAFFYFHWVLISFLFIVLIIVFNIKITIDLWTSKALLGILNSLYLLWLLFACYLNYYIYIYN